MPIFNVVNGVCFLQKQETRTNVALKQEMIPARFSSMEYGYINMSNVMLEENCDDPKIIESVSNIQFYPSPMVGAVKILQGTEETDDFDYTDIIRLCGMADQKWSDYTLPKKLHLLGEYNKYFHDLTGVDAWCDKTDLPPFHIFRFFSRNRHMLYGLNVKLTDDEIELGKKRHCEILTECDNEIDSYRTRVGPYPRGKLSRESESLDQTQLSCVTSARKSGITIITGGPGTGKTKVSGCILREWSNSLVKWRATSLSQDAVERIRDAFSRNKRFTQNFANTDNLKRDSDKRWVTHLLIDEMSMVNSFVFASILRMFPSLTSVVLVGDIDQLDPVGCGRPYERMIQTKKHIRLTTNYRMTEGKYSFVHVQSVPQEAMYLHPYRSDQKPGSRTVHKAQGSEYSHVVLGTSAERLTEFSMNRKIVYTAVTRSRSSVVSLMGAYTPEVVERIMYGRE